MAYIGLQGDGSFGSSGRTACSQPSFLVSPRPTNQRDSLSSALERAFGQRRGLYRRLMSLEAVDKAYVWLYLLQMHRRGFKLLTIHQSLTTLSRFLLFLNGCGQRHVGEVRRSDLEAFVEYEQDRGFKLSTVRTILARGSMRFFLFWLRRSSYPRIFLFARSSSGSLSVSHVRWIQTM